MSGANHIDDTRVQAYIDGELDPAMAAEVETWLAANPAQSARVASMRRNDDLLRSALAPVLDEVVPKSLRSATLPQPGVAAQRPHRGRQAAAVFFALLAGGLSGWGARHYMVEVAGAQSWPARYAQHALDAHVVYAADLRHPVEVKAPERDHLDQWLSRRLKREVTAPDLSGAGFELLGGRLLSERGRPAALYMYEDDKGKRLSVLIDSLQPNARFARPKMLLRDNIGALSWAEGQLVLAVSGELGSDRLRGVSELVTMSLRRGA